MIRIAVALSAVVFVALALHVKLGCTLWIYLVSNAVVEGFDTNGVFVSLLIDIQHLIPDDKERAEALKMFGMVFVPLIICSMVTGFLIHEQYAMVVSLVASALQVLYTVFFFPETAPRVIEEGDHSAVGLRTVLQDVRRVFSRNSFIRRVAIVIAFFGFAAGSLGVLFPPFMTGRLGIKKADKLQIVATALPIAIIFLALWNRVISCIGLVRVLQIAVLGSSFFVAACLMCNQLWQLLVVLALCVGPISWGFPTLLRIKSNLVAEDEQGTAQGATAGIGKGAAFIGIVFMGQFFKRSTQHGDDLQQGLIPPFLTVAGVYFAAFLLTLSLPATLPPTPLSEGALELPSVAVSSSPTHSALSSDSHSSQHSSISSEVETVSWWLRRGNNRI